ncbi:hypothetical protein [Bacillus cereus]|uniref:hypothetical protein n=1 Tax=Bacillus cereus TaxID=1396 RepID=UPI0011557B01|nr:hypothetical protein [Bacillus cereus]
MKVIYKNVLGGVVYTEENDDIPGLMAILKESKTVKFGIWNYEVKSYNLEYYQIDDKSRKMKSELVIELKQKIG